MSIHIMPPLYEVVIKVGPPKPTSDKNEESDVNRGYCQYWNANAQSFTPDHDYKARKLSLQLNRYALDRKGPYIVKIMTPCTDCWACPVLWSESRQSENLPNPGVKEWIHFDLPNLILLTGVQYLIVVHTTPGWYWWDGTSWWLYEAGAALNWWVKADTNPYPRGWALYGCNFRDGSGVWYDHYNDDYTFIVYE